MFIRFDVIYERMTARTALSALALHRAVKIIRNENIQTKLY